MPVIDGTQLSRDRPSLVLQPGLAKTGHAQEQKATSLSSKRHKRHVPRISPTLAAMAPTPVHDRHPVDLKWSRERAFPLAEAGWASPVYRSGLGLSLVLGDFAAAGASPGTLALSLSFALRLAR